jgi:hypothetical protein
MLPFIRATAVQWLSKSSNTHMLTARPAMEKHHAHKCDIPVRDRSVMIHLLQWFLISIAFVAVSLRLTARKVMGHGYGWDDAMIVVAAVMLASTAVLQVISKCSTTLQRIANVLINSA